VASSVSASGPITASAADGVTTGDATCTVGVGGFPATLLASLQVGEAGTTSCTTYADRASSGTIGDYRGLARGRARALRTQLGPPARRLRHVMADLTIVSPKGSVTISRELVAELVAETAARCYGVVGLTPGSRVGRLLRRGGISVEGDAAGMRIELHVVVEYGLNLAEVIATVRSRLAYELERLTGLPVASVEVVVEDVRVTV